MGPVEGQTFLGSITVTNGQHRIGDFHGYLLLSTLPPGEVITATLRPDPFGDTSMFCSTGLVVI